MKDYPLYMWTQMVEEKEGAVRALMECYPGVLAASPILQHAVNQISIAAAAIDACMKAAAAEAEES